MAINLLNKNNRDAVVALEGVRPKRDVQYIDSEGLQTVTRRLLKSDADHDFPALLHKFGEPEIIADEIIHGEPEIDLEQFGMYLTETTRVYVGEEGIVHAVEEFEVITNPDGSERERRARRKEPQNINTDQPLRWTGKMIKKSDAINRFLFNGKKQLVHTNGLTFDFLYEIAKELAEKDSLLLVRGGEKSDRPLILQRGGKQYNGFLEGRIEGETYCLILHLSNMELKKPEEIVKEESV